MKISINSIIFTTSTMAINQRSRWHQKSPTLLPDPTKLCRTFMTLRGASSEPDLLKAQRCLVGLLSRWMWTTQIAFSWNRRGMWLDLSKPRLCWSSDPRSYTWSLVHRRNHNEICLDKSELRQPSEALGWLWLSSSVFLHDLCRPHLRWITSSNTSRPC